MFAWLRNFFALKRYQSEVNTEDAFRPWESFMLKSILFVSVVLLAYTLVVNSHEFYGSETKTAHHRHEHNHMAYDKSHRQDHRQHDHWSRHRITHPEKFHQYTFIILD